MCLSGDLVALLLPPDATRADIQRATNQLGLDKPLWTLYLIFKNNLAHLDFGTSIHLRQPTFTIALERLLATIELASAALFVVVVVAVLIGVLAAMKPYSLRPSQPTSIPFS